MLQYSGVSKWVKPNDKGKGDAAMRSKTERFKVDRPLSECYGNVPVVTSRGTSATVAKANRSASSWTKNSGHETFLPG